MRIAFLGLGIMGRPMAANLVRAGHDVTAWNRTPGKDVPGARTASSPAEAAADADVVWICVSNTDAVEHVLFGANGVEQSLKPGMAVVDSSTILPSASAQFAEKIRAKGADFIDAPVTGSKSGAEAATLIFIVGGKNETVARVAPLFEQMGKQYVHVGENGKGEAAKLAMNLQIALIYEGFAEGLTLARRLGVDQEALFTLILSSMIRSGVMDYKLPFVRNNDFSPNFPLRLMHKDMKLMLQAAAEAGVELPGLATVERVYQKSHAAGRDDLDYAASILDVEHWHSS